MSFDTQQIKKGVGEHIQKNVGKYSLTGSGVLSAVVALGTVYFGSQQGHKVDVQLHEEVSALKVEIQNIKEDIDFNQERMDAIETDYNDQIKDESRKRWTTNRIFRTEISELQRKVNQ